MKYIVVLGDGMADYDVAEFGGATILDVAEKPNMDTRKFFIFILYIFAIIIGDISCINIEIKKYM